MSQQNVLAMRAIYDAYNRGDLGTVENGLSPSVEWNAAENYIYAQDRPYKGFAEIRDGILKRAPKDFEDFRVDVEQFFDAGDTVIATGRYRGVAKETGKRLNDQFCHVLHVDEKGKLDRFHQYADTLHAAEVTGQIKRVTEKAPKFMTEPA